MKSGGSSLFIDIKNTAATTHRKPLSIAVMQEKVVAVAAEK